MARLGGFPENRSLNIDALFEVTASSSGSETVQTSLPPGPERDAILNELVGALSEQATDSTAMIEELRGLMVGRDITQLINAVVVPAMTVRSTGTQSVADGNTTSTWAAKVEYLVGVALSMTNTGDAGTPTDVMHRVTQLISDIFEAEQLRLIAQTIEKADSDTERELLLQQMQLEYQTDRMPGYAVHLERVDSEVFGRHRDYYMNALGFDPADVIRCTRLHTRSIGEMYLAGINAMAEALNAGGINRDGEQVMRHAFDAITLWKPADVAASTGIDAEQITAMLDFFSTEYGCQPAFRAPSDLNRVRTHPCIRLGNLTYLVPDPWALSAGIHRRLAAETTRKNYDPKKYFKHRQDAHERLVTSALRTVFGQANVYSTQHYNLAAGTHGEIDSLVCTEWPLVVEAKAIALTEPGRRGAPSRVDTKIKTILSKALDQTDRALSYILDQRGRTFAPTENGRAVELLPDVAGGTAIIVTFERIDPFASGGLTVAGRVNRPTWVVSLTDLLMTTDILTDPSAFHHYARRRAEMHSARARTLAEADTLGAYLLSRLSILDSADENTSILIGHSCEALNEFYTRQEAGWAAEKPETGVSGDVTAALTMACRQPGWVTAVDAVMTSDPSVWKKWKNFRRKHRRGGVFPLNGHVCLVTSTAGESSFERSDDSLLINIPRPS
ncbi:hypothetical protein [Rhodococcus sp. IEGM 1330]|uniref:hypothetical protein n=1 Tax=Rhodococcus sp. IEGM 1330 TaxID=3082225 RepID=UPI002954F9D9|nr:hypothetical protein [Rhodococcus sp. IEGM 1330]MDV8022696.1 hypothetical protein [Rhodococcus sp. IEGM 1330]